MNRAPKRRGRAWFVTAVIPSRRGTFTTHQHKRTPHRKRSAPLDTKHAPRAAALLTVERSLSFSVCLRRSGTVTSAAMRTLDPALRTDEDTGRIDPERCFFYGRGHMKVGSGQGLRVSQLPVQQIHISACMDTWLSCGSKAKRMWDVGLEEGGGGGGDFDSGQRSLLATESAGGANMYLPRPAHAFRIYVLLAPPVVQIKATNALPGEK